MSQFMPSRRLFAALPAILATAVAFPAKAAEFVIKFYGGVPYYFKGRKRVAIPGYIISYITSQQATAVAGINARTRLNATLAGVPEETFRKLVDEAHADLKAQLTAAGVPLASDEEARGVITQAGLALVPDNKVSSKPGIGISVGNNIKKAFTSYGASTAPAVEAFSSAAYGFSTSGAAMKLGKFIPAIDATLLFPLITVDFAEMEARSASGLLSLGASAGGKLQFAIRLQSPTALVHANDKGAATAGMLWPTKDAVSKRLFASTEQGAGGVKEMATGSSRGDLVVVDVALWSDLVRTAFRDYNAAVVENVLKLRKS